MYKKLSIFIFGFLLMFGSTIAFAETSYKIVPDCNKGSTVNAGSTGLGTACDFNTFILLINNVINFLLFTIATPLAALAICYAGFLLLTGGSNEHKRSQAKGIIKNVIIGYIIALAAWLIIKTIFVTLGFTGNTFLK